MNKKQKYVYLLKIPEKSIYKIGVSKDVEKRIKQLQTGNYEQITLVHKFKSNYPYKIESILHGMYKFKRIEGEWYDMSAILFLKTVYTRIFILSRIFFPQGEYICIIGIRRTTYEEYH